MCQHRFINIDRDFANDIMETEYRTNWCEICGAIQNERDAADKYTQKIDFPESIKLYDLAKMYEEIEAMLLLSESGCIESMPDEIYDKMMEAQKLRNELLYPKNEETK